MKYLKHIIASLSLALIALSVTPSVSAVEKEAGSAAGLAYRFEKAKHDTRPAHLEAYLKQFNSPLAGSAAHFVAEADRLELDWKFVAAIAGLESTFGKRVPPGSHNAWGWGIPTGAQSGIAFSSWEKGITTVSEGLRNKYINRGAVTIEQIGRIYAASPTWASRVRYFMEDIESFNPDSPEYIQVTL